jgi:phytol kinase
MNCPFLLNQFVLLAALFSIYYVGGRLVRNHGVKVNYTRKINHFAIFFLPFALDSLFAYEKTGTTKTLSLLVGIGTVAVFVRPIRERFAVLQTMFLSFDRPEDRPHTVLWLLTQYCAAAVVIIPLAMYLTAHQQRELLFVPLLINGLGDGLAEPVGVRFGRLKYNTRALFSDTIYQRSLEGSLCVFVVGALSIVVLRDLFTAPGLVAALLTVPLATTLAEAFSPHTWDTPFIYASGGGLLVGITHFLG